RLLAAISIARVENVMILQNDAPRWLDRLRMTARQWLEAGFTRQTAVDHALLRALVLGDLDPRLRDIHDEFVRTGTSHHLAISGMHIAILGGLALLLCRLIGLGPRAACVAAVGAVIVYATVVLPSPPVIRSMLLCIMFAGAILLGRRVDGVQLLAASVLVMLVWHPL